MLRQAVIPSLFACLFAANAVFATVGSQDDPVPGWASQNGGTTGGKGGTEVTVTTMADLQKYAKMSGKYVIWVKGTMGDAGTRGEGNGDRVVVASDKSILGLPGAVVNGGFDINGVKNVILRNFSVQGPGACDNKCGSAGEGRKDAISIVSGASNIWLDHMEVLDGEDGNTDITKKSDFVTVSWTRFRYTDKSYVSGVTDWSHRFCNLLGGSDSEGSDGKLSVTFYKTHWGEGVAERMPRVRFGKVHVANCLFNSTDKGQGHDIRAAYKADLLIEGNLFVKQKKPIDLYEGDYTAVTVASSNVFDGCSGNTAGNKTAFTPPYAQLTLSSAAGLATELTDAANGAGPTIDAWSEKPVSVAFRAASTLRLEREGGLWALWNNTPNDLSGELVSLDGRHLGTVLVPAGNSAALPASRLTRIVRFQNAEGGADTRLVPGF